MDEIEAEIRDAYKRMNHELTEKAIFSGEIYNALSQYGYVLETGFLSPEAAENYAIDFYRNNGNMVFIRQ